jgi:hypothetical protein
MASMREASALKVTGVQCSAHGKEIKARQVRALRETSRDCGGAHQLLRCGSQRKEAAQGFIPGARILSEVLAQAGQERRIELFAACRAA